MTANKKVYWAFAALNGALLAAMIHINGDLARYTSPTWSSFVAHGVGGVFAWVIWRLMALRRGETTSSAPLPEPAPWWAYLGGVPGAFVVIFASMAVNSELGLAGAVALMLLGQVIFGLAADVAGFLQHAKRKLDLHDFFQVLFVMTGTAILIFFAR